MIQFTKSVSWILLIEHIWLGPARYKHHFKIINPWGWLIIILTCRVLNKNVIIVKRGVLLVTVLPSIGRISFSASNQSECCTVHVVGYVNMHCCCVFYRASSGWANVRDGGKNVRPAPLVLTTVQVILNIPVFSVHVTAISVVLWHHY